MSQGSEQSKTTQSKSSGEALAMSKLERPVHRLIEKVRKMILLNDSATISLRVKVERHESGVGFIREIRALDDINELV